MEEDAKSYENNKRQKSRAAATISLNFSIAREIFMGPFVHIHTYIFFAANRENKKRNLWRRSGKRRIPEKSIFLVGIFHRSNFKKVATLTHSALFLSSYPTNLTKN